MATNILLYSIPFFFAFLLYGSLSSVIGDFCSYVTVGESDDPTKRHGGVLRANKKMRDSDEVVERKRKCNKAIRIICYVLWPIVFLLLPILIYFFMEDESDLSNKGVKVNFKSV